MPAPGKNTDRYKSMAHYFGALIRDLRDSYELRVGEPLTVAQLSAGRAKRRQLFQLTGLGLFAQSPLFSAGEPVRQMS